MAQPGTNFRTALTQFDALAAQHARFGAIDTEPRAVLADILRAVHQGDKPRIPRTATEWELYSTMPGSDSIAEKLDSAAGELAAVGAENSAELGQYLRGEGLI